MTTTYRLLICVLLIAFIGLRPILSFGCPMMLAPQVPATEQQGVDASSHAASSVHDHQLMAAQHSGHSGHAMDCCEGTKASSSADVASGCSLTDCAMDGCGTAASAVISSIIPVVAQKHTGQPVASHYPIPSAPADTLYHPPIIL